MGLECGQQLHYCESVIGAKLLHVHSASPFSQPLSTPFESRFFFWTDATPSITDKGQNRSTAPWHESAATILNHHSRPSQALIKKISATAEPL
jgi:hypothetical protein